MCLPPQTVPKLRRWPKVRRTYGVFSDTTIRKVIVVPQKLVNIVAQ